ncbi:MAG: hypothetical protein ACQEQR_03045 [Pseudomonadota bacterium]
MTFAQNVSVKKIRYKKQNYSEFQQDRANTGIMPGYFYCDLEVEENGT